MRPGRPIQMTLRITAAATPVISLAASDLSIMVDLPGGKVNIPKHKRAEEAAAVLNITEEHNHACPRALQCELCSREVGCALGKAL